MLKKHYETVIIGAGIGGCGAAALLAKDHGIEVAVFEKAPHIGGRVASYVGKGDKVTIDGLELDYTGFRKSLADARCWLSYCEPELETIFEKGLVDGYTIDNGGHGLFWGNKSRCRLLLDHLGEPVDMPTNRGLAFVDARTNEIYQVAPLEPYRWMTKEGFNAAYAALRAMGGLSMDEVAAAMNVSLEDWLDERKLNLNEEAYDYIKVVMACQNAMAEPRMAPAGDFLGYMAMARDIGMNLHTGSVATVGEPGPMAIPLAMERALHEAGGQILRSTPIEEVMIEDGKVRGVVVRTKENAYHVIETPIVICNIPPKHIFNVIHPRHFPQEWVRKIQNEFWSPGLLSATIALKNDVWERYGVDERSFTWMPGIIKDERYIGAVDMVMGNLASMAKRAPEGKRDFIFSTALTDREMRTPSKVNRVIDYCMEWFRRTFTDWKENVEFVIWTPSDEAYGNWRPVGTERPDVKSPFVEGLYFVGDQYGTRLWGGGVDGASLSAVMCVDAITGSQLEHNLYPPYHQGIPTSSSGDS